MSSTEITEPTTSERNAAPPTSAGREGFWAQWQAYLFTEVDGASLAVFRVVFSGLIAWEVVRYFANHRIQRYYMEPQFFFSYVDFIKPWGGQGMIWHFIVLGVCAALCAVGLFYRVAAAICGAALTYVFLLDKTEYLNHLYLCSLLGLLLAFIPAHRVGSLDRLWALRRAERSGTAPPGEGVPRWALLLLRLQVALVYFFGGIAKINGDWLAGRPLDMWLPARAHMPIIGPILAQPGIPLAVAHAGLLIDLSVPFLLFSRRGLPWGIAIATLFHLANAIIFKIGIFPFVMIGALALFPDPSWPRRLLRQPPAVLHEGPRVPRSVPRRLILVALHGYLLLQFVMPLRHWRHPGDVAWNELGHRFSWRMKLRNKKVKKLQIYMVDPETGAREKVDPKALLTQRQVREMGTKPDMLVDFAHLIADRQQAAVGVRPIVRAKVQVSLNGHPPASLVDPKEDLASVPRGFVRP
ncbi:HTTM domain-containing protein [Chondromyces crocatus]|uniref:Type I deoxyribonuclease HsdR n=1 Tax=Chondromyces crocatus TaxID=52 RepID=A0A0K1ENA0_CHOCO|nr:HTTM domain-containing protein [Chondromyces crocatus]AKT42102.1 type I deoxyribonuclease HsdR [Chondromyces crocatus]